jgi:hypothetical protein
VTYRRVPGLITCRPSTPTLAATALPSRFLARYP